MSRPIADSTHSIPEIAFVVTRLDCGDVIGESYLLAFHYSPNAIAGALRDASELAVGWNPAKTEEFAAHFERESEYFGNPGINRWALGSVNLAMWDAVARSQGIPAWRMFEAHADRTPLYGSGGWLSYSVEELVEEATRYVSRGFGAVKIKVGSADIENDIERLAKVREAVGPGIDIMMDANQGMNLDSACRLAKSVKSLRITWFEEPLPNTDFEGYRSLGKTAGILLAMGEREFNTVALRELVARDAIDLWQPDILRLGGVEAWRSSAAFAEAHGIPVLPHYYKEYDVPLLMTIPNGRGAESFDWVDPLIDQPIRMRDGFAYPNDGPGWGFQFKDDCLRNLTV